MSGSAAIAGARRRRASNENTSSIRDNKQDESSKTNTQESRTYSVVQVIQMHENRIKRLEEKIMGTDDNSVRDRTLNQDNKILERIDKLESAINNINKDSKDSKDISNIEKSINNSILELDNKLKVEKDNMHNRISNIEENLEKINSTISVEKILTELNELKTIVIKSQLLSLETSNKLSALETLSDKENGDNENMTSTDNLLFLETLLKNEYNVDLTEPINTTDETVDLDLDNIIDISSIVNIDTSAEFVVEEVNNNQQEEMINQDNQDNNENNENKDKIDEDIS